MHSLHLLAFLILLCFTDSGRDLSPARPAPSTREPLISSSSAHKHVPRRIGDDRSSCPALNALANHVYLPHDGRGITHSTLFSSIQSVYGLSYPLASVLTLGTYALLRQVPPLSLNDISRTHGIEHNCSLAHDDVLSDEEYPSTTPDACLLRELIGDLLDNEGLDINDIAHARVRREESPEYRYCGFALDALSKG